MGDPRLFPPDVVQMHSEGQARRARRLLLSHARRFEQDEQRAARQRSVAGELRLWLDPVARPPGMYRLNGIGTTLLGTHQSAPDGSYIGTLWFTLIFVPIFPLTAYLVVPAPEKGWYFLARAPLPPLAGRVRQVAGWVAAGLACLLLVMAYWNAGHTDVVAYNGFDRPVVVSVAGARETVPARQHVLFEDVARRRVEFAARWADGSASFESTVVDLAGHGRGRVVYNVAGRAVLEILVAVYGSGSAEPERLLEQGPVLFVAERPDYLFTAPPDSIEVSGGRAGRRTALLAADAGVDVAVVLGHLLEQDRRAQALAVARAELLAHPDNATVLWIAALQLLPDDREAQLALVRSSLQRAPDSVDLHRLYQEVRKDDPGAVRAEYEALLAAHPASPMYEFLVGRAQREGSEAALAHYRAALRLDPKYAPAHRALGYSAVVRGDWAQALAHYDRFASLGDVRALEALDSRLRLRRRLRRDPAESLRILAQAHDAHPDAGRLDFLAAHLRVELDASRLAAEEDTLVRRAGRLVSADALQGEVAPNLRAALAITAGDLEAARSELRAVAGAGQRSPDIVLRLALSAGAGPEDVQLLREIPGWYARLSPPYRLAGLALLDSAERASKITGAADPEFESLAAFLDDPERLERAGALDSALAKADPGTRTGAYFAAALRLAKETAPEARRAREACLAQARSFALPGELPFLGRR